MKYLGITVGDLRRDWLHPTDSCYAVFTPIYPEVTTVHMPCFAPALDAFYTRTSDYVGGSFRPVGAVRFDERTIRVLGKGGGFVLATGCEYPANAPFERAGRMIEIAKTEGIY